MAPSLSKFTQARENLIAQVIAFLGTTESNFFNETVRFIDYPPDANDIWAVVPLLAIYPARDGIEFETETRRHVAGNTTAVETFMFRGFTRGDWATIEALEVDCRRAVLENGGLDCAATSSLWDSLSFGIEVQRKEQSQDRRCVFEATLRVQIVEELKP